MTAMQLSDDVILDLMPLYLGQSASADTRRVVEAYLAMHPELASRLGERCATEGADGELETLRRTRHAIRMRNWQLSLAITLTLAPLSFWFESGASGSHFWMLVREVPSLAEALWVAAAGFWVGYAIWSRRTQATGL
jgi:hypothetical protein